VRAPIFSMSIAAAVTLAGCTTTGTGAGQAVSGGETATFTWKSDTDTGGTMTAGLSDGSTYEGPFFQVTQDSTVDQMGPLWTGWSGRRGFGGWGLWGPSEGFVTHYSGKVLANLQGPTGYMRCRFTLASPASGMSGGGLGQCQLPTGPVIDAQFARQ
jgi:hypothetical protein